MSQKRLCRYVDSGRKNKSSPWEQNQKRPSRLRAQSELRLEMWRYVVCLGSYKGQEWPEKEGMRGRGEAPGRGDGCQRRLEEEATPPPGTPLPPISH